MKRASALGVLPSLACLCFMAGCGGGAEQVGPERFPVEGKVTVDGAPVAHGEILLLPQSGGGAATVGITNGNFSATGKGAVAGPQKVTVTIFEGPPEDGEGEISGVANTTATVPEGGTSELTIALAKTDVVSEAEQEELEERERLLREGDD